MALSRLSLIIVATALPLGSMSLPSPSLADDPSSRPDREATERALRRDRAEDRFDRREDRRDRREDVREARYEGGRRDRVEDRLDRRENVRDRREDRRDRRVGVNPIRE